ncbi:Maf family protein [Anaerolentibacter hominis]|uniref:Maf family protein n=1 Tax=Anaerolentibacter hominis TaxID=3079009 RepID=UPI0031B87B83
MRRIILASASPRRREILERMGIAFEIMPSTREEVITEKEPCEAVRRLALQKAEDIAEKTSGDVIVLGADTVVALDGKILGKPVDQEDAVRMLESLQGREHQVYTGVAVVLRRAGEEQIISFYEASRVKVGPVSESQIRAYVETGEPMDKAGAYAIQGRFGIFVDEIEGDYYNVVGLPVSKIYRKLLEYDVDLLK